MTEHFERKDDMVIAHCRGGVEMDFDRVIKELEHLEDERIDLKIKYSQMQDRIDELNRVIMGMKAYIRLEVQGVLW